CTLRNIVANAVTSDIVHRVFFRDIFRGFADHNAKFNFPVGLFRATWNANIVEWTANCRCSFHENDWLWWNGRTSFRRMVRKVQANADEFASTSYASTDTFAFKNRQRR